MIAKRDFLGSDLGRLVKVFCLQTKDLMNSREVNRFPTRNAIFDPVAANLDP